MDIKRSVEFVEKVFLVLIAGFTVVAMLQEVLLLVANQKVELKDLLLMFIYAEVLGMLGAFYTSHRIPITIPLFIAMTALSRLIILQGKDRADFADFYRYAQETGKLFYNPTKQIHADRRPMWVCTSKIGYVGQDVFLFSETVIENIAYGLTEWREPSGEASIEEATRLACVHEEGIALTRSYRTRVEIGRAHV